MEAQHQTIMASLAGGKASQVNFTNFYRFARSLWTNWGLW